VEALFVDPAAEFPLAPEGPTHKESLCSHQSAQAGSRAFTHCHSGAFPVARARL